MNKKNIVQITTGVIIISALILNFGGFLGGSHDMGDRKNPLEVTSFEDIDERFLEMLVKDTGMTSDEIKIEMNNNKGKTLSVILEEMGIEMKGPGGDR